MTFEQRSQSSSRFSAMSEAELERLILNERVGFPEIVDILDRLFREDGLKGMTLSDMSLAQLSGLRTSWS